MTGVQLLWIARKRELRKGVGVWVKRGWVSNCNLHKRESRLDRALPPPLPPIQHSQRINTPSHAYPIRILLSHPRHHAHPEDSKSRMGRVSHFIL
jgi:hypothetical protein